MYKFGTETFPKKSPTKKAIPHVVITTKEKMMMTKRKNIILMVENLNK